MARLLCIAVLLVAACAPEPWPGPPALRLSQLGQAYSTPLYRAFDSNTRPLLGRKTGPLPPSVTVHTTLELEARGRSQLEFACGLPANSSAPPVTFRISAASSGKTRTLFETTLSPSTDSERWHEFSVELDLDHPTTLQFVTVPARSDSPPGAAWFSDPILQALNPSRATERKRLPNIVLVSLDTLRADHLSVYGYTRDTSPNMKAMFDEQGLVVENCFAPEVTTLDSHATMMSGLYPDSAVQPGLLGIHRGVTMLAELLADEGYRTAAFTENAFVAAELGFRRGFEVYSENGGIEAKGIERIAANSLGFVRETFDRGIAWVEEHADRPMFVFLHTYQVHSPYTPAPRWAALFPSPEGASPARRDMDAYDAEIAYTDSEVARLLKAIDRALPADDTILIVLSDHGEEFGEHGRRYHGGTLANETLRVPLMLRAPGRLPAGQRRTGPVGLVDLVPTLLELLDIEEPYPLQGRSVLAHLRHDQALPTTPLYSVADSPFTMTYKGVDKSWQPPARAVTLWPDRLLSEKKDDGRRYWLFDLSSDPGQTKDLYEFADQGPQLKRLLEQWPAVAAARKNELSRSLQSRATAHRRPRSDANGLGEDKIRKLKALGYLEPGE